ncbi:YkvA family protein [Streptomyces sp. YIM S03343]
MDTTGIVLVVVAVLAAALFAVAIWVLVRLVRTRRSLERAGLPTGPRWVFWGAVAYLVLPTDLLPDPVYLDDIGVLLLALRSMRSALPAGAVSGTLSGVRRRPGGLGKGSGDGATPGSPDSGGGTR